MGEVKEVKEVKDSKIFKGLKKNLSFPVSVAHAAGIDVGSRFHCVSVGEGTDDCREFGVFTEDLHALCQWLQSKDVQSVAMESTGFYWKQLFLMIQSYGMEACLINAAYTKNIRGRKPSDMADSRWIWKMHSVGILPSSYQPDEFTEELRTYTRHRKGLIEGASHCVSRMQKCLTLMNVHLPVVLSDITGKSGQDIIRAILSGERDGAKLAALADARVKADATKMTKALTGNWKDSYLFELKQHWNMYHFYRQQLQDCDGEIDKLLQNRVQATGQAELVYEPKKKSVTKRMPLPSNWKITPIR
jgi:transposase